MRKDGLITTRGERSALEMVSGFDAIDEHTVTGVDINLQNGSMQNGKLRENYCWRSVHNYGDSAILIAYKVVGDNMSVYHARVPSGVTYHFYMNISQILGNGSPEDPGENGTTSNAKIVLFAKEKAIVDDICPQQEI